MFDPKKILVPIDFSEYSDKALGEAIDMAEKFKAKIYLLHVIDSIQQCAVDYCIPIEAVEKFQAQGLATSKQKMQEHIASQINTKGVEIDYDVRVGSPSDEIVKEQKEKDIDLIVIGSHGRSGIKKFILGSQADYVAHHATAPVMIIRA